MTKWLALLARGEEILAVIALLIIVLCVFIAAIARSFGVPIIASVDIAQGMFMWLCMLGASQTLRREEHVGIDLFTRYLPPVIQRCLAIVIRLLMGAFLVLLIVYGVSLSQLNPERELGVLQWPYSLVTVAIVVGALLMLVTCCVQVFQLTTQQQHVQSITPPALSDTDQGQASPVTRSQEVL